ncbi:hypothetical protein RND81_06G124400 [Saponaria officinalis]|uniref:Uncharacterized protein n=1 Tax=Saponaria officinalis TaxID=3572 RepID=A0AAW1KCC8_SAPOF
MSSYFQLIVPLTTSIHRAPWVSNSDPPPPLPTPRSHSTVADHCYYSKSTASHHNHTTPTDIPSVMNNVVNTFPPQNINNRYLIINFHCCRCCGFSKIKPGFQKIHCFI